MTGIRFDSRKEAKYYEDLLWQQRTGAVKSIELQPEFVLQPGYEVAGKKDKARFIYRADFKVTEANGAYILRRHERDADAGVSDQKEDAAISLP